MNPWVSSSWVKTKANGSIVFLLFTGYKGEIPKHGISGTTKWPYLSVFKAEKDKLDTQKIMPIIKYLDKHCQPERWFLVV